MFYTHFPPSNKPQEGHLLCVHEHFYLNSKMKTVLQIRRASLSFCKGLLPLGGAINCHKEQRGREGDRKGGRQYSRRDSNLKQWVGEGRKRVRDLDDSSKGLMRFRCIENHSRCGEILPHNLSSSEDVFIFAATLPKKICFKIRRREKEVMITLKI